MLGAAWEAPGRPGPIVIRVPVEKCPMVNWLAHLWHRIDGWMRRRAGIPPRYHRSICAGVIAEGYFFACFFRFAAQ
jgi:hypothetical protein